MEPKHEPAAPVVLRDASAAVILLVATFVVELLKSKLFEGRLPPFAAIILNILELTLAATLLITLIKVVCEFVDETKRLGGALRWFGVGIALNQIRRLLREGLITGFSLGLTSAFVVCIALTLIYFMAFLGGAPTAVYYIVLGITLVLMVLPIAAIYGAATKQDDIQIGLAGSASGFAILFTLYFGLFILALIPVVSFFVLARVISPQALQGLLNLLLLRHAIH